MRAITLAKAGEADPRVSGPLGIGAAHVGAHFPDTILLHPHRHVVAGGADAGTGVTGMAFGPAHSAIGGDAARNRRAPQRSVRPS